MSRSPPSEAAAIAAAGTTTNHYYECWYYYEPSYDLYIVNELYGGIRNSVRPPSARTVKMGDSKITSNVTGNVTDNLINVMMENQVVVDIVRYPGAVARGCVVDVGRDGDTCEKVAWKTRSASVLWRRCRGY